MRRGEWDKGLPVLWIGLPINIEVDQSEDMARL